MRPAMSSACQSSLPAEGRVSPAMMRKSVLLPQPEGPSTLRNSPCDHTEIDAFERGHAVAEGFAEAGDGDQIRHLFAQI